jgi:hypothetical protein
MKESENIQDIEVRIELKSLNMGSSGFFLKTINKVRFI